MNILGRGLRGYNIFGPDLLLLLLLLLLNLTGGWSRIRVIAVILFFAEKTKIQSLLVHYYGLLIHWILDVTK